MRCGVCHDEPRCRFASRVSPSIPAAMADYPGLLADVQALMTHPDFLLSNPNRAR